MQLEDVLAVIQDQREHFAREEDQALMSERPEAAKEALWGKFACERIDRAIRARAGIAPAILKSVRRPR